MARQCETFDHTADVGLRARADSLAELFEALAEGLARFICPAADLSCVQARRIEVQAEDLGYLLVDFLWEVMSLMQFERFMVARVKVRQVDERQISAEVQGEPLDEKRHELAAEVKAVTHHQLRVQRLQGEWVGQVILDL